jgi:hypothetical protein
MKMSNGRTVLRWGGAALIVAGVITALASLWTGTSSSSGSGAITTLRLGSVAWTMSWWSLTLDLLWGGIAMIIVGIALVVSHPRYKHIEEHKMEREIGREVLRERAEARW